MFRNKKSAIILVLITCLIVFSGISQAAEQVVRTIKINYPSKAIEGSTTVVTVPGCRYDFTVVGDLPAGTWIEWRDATTTKGKWIGSTLYPYETGKERSGTYSITAVLCGGEGPGPGWQVTVSGVITDPVLTFSEPGIDQYFVKDQTDPKPEVDMKVSVVKPDGTKLEGVNVIFIAQKASDGTRLNIGSQSSTTAGIAAKIWDVPVSGIETFTLYASTGGVWPDLENKATGKKAIVFTVEIKAEDGEADPPGYICVNAITRFKVTIISKEEEQISGEFKWEIVKGKKYADIVAGEKEQTVSVKGLEPSVKGKKDPTVEKVNLELTFTPSGLKKGFEREHEFVVVKADLTIYVDQPGAGGDRDTYEVISWVPLVVDVGHAWWKFSISYADVIIEDLRNFVNKPAGYYPSTPVNPFTDPTSPGIVQMPDTGHVAEVSKTYNLTSEQLVNGLTYTKTLYNNPGIYNLNTNNCADAAIQAGTSAGQSIPDTQGTWPGGGGSNPGDLGEDLR